MPAEGAVAAERRAHKLEVSTRVSRAHIARVELRRDPSDVEYAIGCNSQSQELPELNETRELVTTPFTATKHNTNVIAQYQVRLPTRCRATSNVPSPQGDNTRFCGEDAL